MSNPIVVYVAAVLTAAALAGPVHSQTAPGPKREFLQTFDVPPGQYEVRMGTSEIGPNRTGGRQSHPGPEAGYVLRGDAAILVAGQPPMRLTAGRSYKLAPGAIHELRAGPQGVTLLITWIVEKGKPFETMPR